MAGIADIAAEDVSVRLARCSDQGTAAMTARALGGSAFEHSARVATLTVDPHMGAVQREAGGKMIEIDA